MLARLLTGGLFAGLLIATATMAADKKEEDAVKKALQQVGEMVGEWKGNGKAKVGTKEQLWKETISLGWKFKGGESWIAVEFKDGKNFTAGDLKYVLDKKFYRLTVTDVNKKEQVFDGTIVKGNLVLTSKDKDSGDVQKLTLFTLADGARMMFKSELQAKGKGLFAEQFQIAATKEGESFAGGGGKKNECLITGGLGTIAVSYMGKTYYVCCSGCRDEFNDNPKKYVDAFEKKK